MIITIHDTDLLIAVLLQFFHLPVIVRLLVFRLEEEED